MKEIKAIVRPNKLAQIRKALMSLDGFPQPKSAAFQRTVGAAAFTVFQWRGKMTHGLDEPIPGAPALTPRACVDTEHRT